MSVYTPRFRRAGFAAFLLVLLNIAWTYGWAVDTVSLTIANQQGAGWRASGIKARLALKAGAGPSELTIERLSLPKPIGSLHNFSIRCSKLRLTSKTIACSHAQLHLPSPYLDSPEFAASLRYGLDTHRLAVSAAHVALAGGHAKLKLVSARRDWQLHIHGRALDIKELGGLAAHFISRLPQLSATGKTSFALALQGRGNSPTRLSASVDASNLEFSVAGGNVASSGLQARVKLNAHALDRGWAVNLHLAGGKGEAYADPVYLDLKAHPLQAALDGVWLRKSQTLNLKDWSVNQKNVIDIHGSGRAHLRPKFSIDRLKASVSRATFPGVYTVYAQPFLIGTLFDSLSSSGRMSGALAIQHGALHNVALKLDRVSFDDKQHRLGFRGLTGDIHWQSSGVLAQAPRSTLAWQGGALLHLELGATRLAFRTSGKNIDLVKPAHIPVFDGALDIHKLRLKHLGTPRMNILFDSTLLPISMPRLSKALGWPTLGGTLAGRLPSLSYKHGLLTFGGTVLAGLFDGRAAIEHLRLNRPFSKFPTLSADVHMRRLNLKTITHTFSFGEMRGLINGDVDNLQLLDWAPVRFDARFYTPVNDPTEHVISQRALNQITNLGGSGASGALARGFISLFSSFSYDRIGLSCRLKQEICAMGGLRPAQNNGYYIITGAGLPQVQVIGHSRAVSWPTLVNEIEKASTSRSPVVK